MERSAAGLGGTWLLSCLPLALPLLWPPAEASLGEASRLALAALPWVAWIGSPRPSGGSSPRGGATAAALSMPPLCAAMAVDLGRGRDLADLSLVGVASLAMILLLAAAASGAARSSGARSRFAFAWALLVPGLPLLRAALEVGSGRAPAWLARLGECSPIAWAWERAAASPDRGSPPWAALAVCAVLLAISRVETGADGTAAAEAHAR